MRTITQGSLYPFLGLPCPSLWEFIMLIALRIHQAPWFEGLPRPLVIWGLTKPVVLRVHYARQEGSPPLCGGFNIVPSTMCTYIVLHLNHGFWQVLNLNKSFEPMWDTQNLLSTLYFQLSLLTHSRMQCTCEITHTCTNSHIQYKATRTQWRRNFQAKEALG